MKHHSVDMKRWMPLAAALALAFVMWGCGTESNPAGSGSTTDVQLDPPAVGSGAGLLAVSMQSVGTLNDSCATDTTDHGHGGGHGKPERTRLQDLFITFDSIRVYPACHDSLRDGDPDSSGTGPLGPPPGDRDSTCTYLEFLISPLTLNVADLDSEMVLLLGTIDLPDGEYSHIAVHISDATAVTEDGETVAVELPGDVEYLKVLVRFTVAEGQVSEITIRFDLGRSVVEAPPGSKHFILKPVLHGKHGHGDGYMGDMKHGRGRGHGDDDGATFGTGFNTLSSGNGISNDNGDRDRDRLQDGTCDSTGVPDKDQQQDKKRDGVQQHDRDRDQDGIFAGPGYGRE